MTVLDFGSKFTSYAFERRVTLENKGRRAQVPQVVQRDGARAADPPAQAPRRRPSRTPRRRAAGRPPRRASGRRRKGRRRRRRPRAGGKKGPDVHGHARGDRAAAAHGRHVHVPRLLGEEGLRAGEARVREPRRQGQERQARVQHAREGRLHRAAARVHQAGRAGLRSTTWAEACRRWCRRAADADQPHGARFGVQPAHADALLGRRLGAHSGAGRSPTVRVEFDPGYKGTASRQLIDTRITVVYQDAPAPRLDPAARRDQLPEPRLRVQRRQLRLRAQRHDQDAARARDQLLEGRDRLPVGVPRGRGRGARGEHERASRTSR